MEFGIEKCAMLIIKSRKSQITEGIELPNQERIRMLGGKENCLSASNIPKYLGILEADTIKQAEMKEKKIKKRVSQGNEKCSRNQALQQKSYQRENT